MKLKVIVSLIAIAAIVAVVIFAWYGKDSASETQIEIEYPGPWIGGYGVDDDDSMSFKGTGNKIFTISDMKYSIGGYFKKRDNSSETLTVNIIKDGEVVWSKSTTDVFGGVTIIYALDKRLNQLYNP